MSDYLFYSTLLIEPTNVCNLKCKMCEARCSAEKNIVPKFLNSKDLDLMLSKLSPYVTNIVFQGDCEPTMHPNLESLVSVSRKYIKHISIVTNGLLLNEKRIESLINQGVSWFAFSIDKYIKEDYEEIRINSDFDKVVRNLECLIKLREEKYPNIRIVVHKIVFNNETPDDLKNFIRYFYINKGVDKITFAPLVEKGAVKYKDWIIKRNQIEIDFLKENLNVNLKDFANYPFKTLYRYCGANCFFISHDGTFSPCGVHTRSKNVFGNLINETIEDIVNKGIYKEFHEYWQKRKFQDHLPRICDDCFILKTPYFLYSLDENYNNCKNIKVTIDNCDKKEDIF